MKRNTNVKALISFITMISIIASSLLFSAKEVKADEVELPSRFNVKEVLEEAGTTLTLKNQHSYGICVDMASSSVIEAQVKYGKLKGKYGFITETPVYSVLPFSGGSAIISKDQVDPIINDYFNGEITNEADLLAVPDVANEDGLKKRIKEETKPQISSATVDGEANGHEVSWCHVVSPTYKRYEDGVIKYYNENFSEEITYDEVLKRRNDAKEYIYNHGACMTSICTEGMHDGLDGKKICLEKERPNDNGGHVVTIIGWDDNYPKENFPEDDRPSNNGAWIAQNSWGTWGEDGIFHISYEDVYVDEDLLGLNELVPFKDKTKPRLSLDIDETNYTVKIKSCTDNYGDGIDESSFKYAILNHNLVVNKDDDIGWKSFNRNDTISYSRGQYVYVKVADKAGNVRMEQTGEETCPLSYRFDSVYEKGTWSNKDVVINLYDAGAELAHLDPKDYDVHYYCDTITQEEFAKMETINDDKSHTLTISKNGKHHIIAAVCNPGEDEEYSCLEWDVWIDKTSTDDNGGDNKENEGGDNDSSGNETSPEKKDDKSVADKIIPNTGSKAAIYLFVIGFFVVIARRSRKKSKKMRF